ncbi:MAG: hypothetical protein LBG88_02845, partial [Christensenellaceae bacterium]|nr:hypothetical protein [Christensenellaceae bacterium]
MENSQEKLDKNIRDNMLARLGVTKPYLVFSLIAVVLILGIFSVTKFKTELFPNMNLPYVVVSYGPQRTLDEGEPYTADGKANYKPLQWVKSTYIVDDTDPENIEYGYNYYNPNLLTEPTERFTSLVENYLQMAQGVKNIDSMSIANGSIIIFIEFNSGIDADTAVAQVNQAIGRVDYTRPFNNSPAFHSSISFSQPIVQKISMDMMPVFAFTSTYLADL